MLIILRWTTALHVMPLIYAYMQVKFAGTPFWLNQVATKGIPSTFSVSAILSQVQGAGCGKSSSFISCTTSTKHLYGLKRARHESVSFPDQPFFMTEQRPPPPPPGNPPAVSLSVPCFQWLRAWDAATNRPYWYNPACLGQDGLPLRSWSFEGPFSSILPAVQPPTPLQNLQGVVSEPTPFVVLSQMVIQAGGVLKEGVSCKP